MKIYRKYSISGFTLVEVLVSLGMISILMVAFLPILLWMMNRSNFSVHSSQANLLLQEMMEVGYNVLAGEWDENWEEYEVGIYHPYIDTTMDRPVWGLLGGEQNVEARFIRKIELRKICREKKVKGDIVSCLTSGAVEDVDSKLMLGSISWVENGKTMTKMAELLVVNLTN